MFVGKGFVVMCSHLLALNKKLQFTGAVLSSKIIIIGDLKIYSILYQFHSVMDSCNFTVGHSLGHKDLSTISLRGNPKKFW